VAARVILARGDIVLAASAGDYGKPRPNFVIQSDAFSNMPSVTVCPLTSDLQTIAPLFRIVIKPTPENGIHLPSQIAVDKITTLPTTRIAAKLGSAGDDVMLQVTRAVAVFLGLS
jgi:mRNA interferase MazF